MKFKIFPKIFLTIFSILITLWICNFILKLTKYQQKFSFYDFATNGKNDTYTFDKDLIYRFKSDQNYRNYKALPKENDYTQNIAFVGDSVTWGYGATDNATYPLTFEKIINQNHPQNKFSVYNFGVPGYGLDQEYLLIKTKIIPELKPKIIVWNINENDIRDNNYMCLFNGQKQSWQKIPATHNIAYWYSWSGSNLPSIITSSNLFNYFWQSLFQVLTQSTNESLYTFGCSHPFSSQKYDQQNFERLLYSVQELKKELATTDTKLIITLVPYQKYFDNRYTLKDLNPDYFFIRNILTNSDINFLDFNENLLNQFKNTSNPNKNNFSQDYFLDSTIDRNPDGLRHPNQKTYNLMASTLYDYFLKMR